MSAPYTCPTCGYYTAYGNAATITFHQVVSHGPGEPIVGVPSERA